MMTLKPIDLRCPVCESVFESMAASSNDEAGQVYCIDPATPVSTAVAMLPFLAVPNVLPRARPSWNLTISRHCATRPITTVRGPNDVHVRMRWLTSTYPLATESTRMALALLFSLL